MRAHTNDLKTNISSYGRIIDTRIYHYLNYNLISENEDTIITEDNIPLISEQIDENNKELLDNSKCYAINIVKNGQLLQSLMKEFDFESEYNLKVGEILNPQLGVLVNNAFEYLDYGNYVIYSKEFNEESQRWNYVCYDKMLYAMILYKPLNITYPCTIRDYINAIANRIGLTFANASDTFTNYNQLIASDLFANQGLTYRDVLDKLSEITASNILINDNDELEIGYPNETNDTINEANLKDVNVRFNEKFGVINKVAIIDSDGGFEYIKENTQSIQQNGATQINITDNILAFNGETDTICQNILDKLNGLYYYICDFKTTGVCYYDYLDLFNVSANGNNYQCLLLNNEINIKDGIDETIYNEKFKESETESNNYKTSIMSNKQVQFKINQQEGKIESKVEKNGIISAINQTAEEVQIDASKISFAGKTIDMQSSDFSLVSDNIKIDKNGYTLRKEGNDEAKFGIERTNFIAYSAEWNDVSHLVQFTSSALLDNIVSLTSQNGLYIDTFFSDYVNGMSVGCENLAAFKSMTDKNYFNEGYANELTVYNSFSNLSDVRYKDKIEELDDYSKFILNLKPKKYILKTSNKESIGFIAQDIEKQLKEYNLPNTIVNKENDIYTLNYIEMIPMLVQTLQKQQEQINILKNKIQKLESECEK